MALKKQSDEVIIKEKILNELTGQDVRIHFPDYIEKEAESIALRQQDDSKRLDLRHLDCFTLDSSDAKDLDDAISLDVTELGYRLGVHIADVTAYAPAGSSLAKEAELRGTTIYFPGYTIPMFPAAISERGCSLNAGSDKRTVSILIDLDWNGNVLKYAIHRSIIRSRVRGIYEEVSRILDGSADESESEKYTTIIPAIKKMHRLASILRDRRRRSGANVDTNSECKYVFENGQLKLMASGGTEADMIVCEFMVVANTCISCFFADNQLPGMYRIQTNTSQTARYSTEQQNHESLAICGGYMRFTSPIRRAADYMTHHVLTAYLDGASVEELRIKFSDQMKEYCGRAQYFEERACKLESAVIKECHLLYFSQHPEDSFKGIIVGANRKTGEAIIELEKYRIRILGASILSKFIGQEYLVKVMADMESNLLRVGKISRPAA